MIILNFDDLCGPEDWDQPAPAPERRTWRERLAAAWRRFMGWLWKWEE